jgi:RNA exonuclease 1
MVELYHPTLSSAQAKDFYSDAPNKTISRSVDKFTSTFNVGARPFQPAGLVMGFTLMPKEDTRVHKSISPAVRSIPLNLFHKEYLRIYAALPNFEALANRDAVKEELDAACSSSSAQVYKVTWRHQHNRVAKRTPVTYESDTGTLSDLQLREIEKVRKEKWEAPLTAAELVRAVHSKEELALWGYITREPPVKSFKQDEMVACHRCTTMFTPSTRTQYPCVSHWGKHHSSSGNIWSCCQKEHGSRGCTTHPCHVRRVTSPGELASIRPFTTLEPLVKGQHHEVVSLDCEMVYTLNGMELGRLTVLDSSDSLIFDVLVHPASSITDFNTRFSGITREMFTSSSLGAPITFDAAIALFKRHVADSTIIIGHGLENDLLALRVVHTRVVDTALLYVHPKGRPWRYGLKEVVKRETGMDVQVKGVEGHSSVEDAAAAALLVRKWARGYVFPGIGKVRLSNGGDDVGKDIVEGEKITVDSDS